MSLNRWKVLACTLTVGVGGLAVFATDPAATKADPAKEPAPLPPTLTVKPASPANGTDTPAPVVPVKGEEFELTVPVPDVPPPTKPAVEAPEIPVIPVRGEAAPDAKKPEPVKPDTPPVVVLPVPAKPDTPKISAPEAPKAPPANLDIPIVPKPAAEPTPPPPLKVDPPVPAKPAAPPVKEEPPILATPPAPPAVGIPEGPPAPPAASKSRPAPVAKGDAAKLKMLLRMGDGQPRFEIRNTGSADLLLKVYGEKIEMQGPSDGRSSLAGVAAVGRVRFTAPGLEGTCDHLRILSGTGEVLLEGNIHLKARHGKVTSEMTAEKMVYQIGTSGLTTPATPRVTPAGYLPD